MIGTINTMLEKVTHYPEGSKSKAPHFVALKSAFHYVRALIFDEFIYWLPVIVHKN